jgi:hypothetical protein
MNLRDLERTEQKKDSYAYATTIEDTPAFFHDTPPPSTQTAPAPDSDRPNTSDRTGSEYGWAKKSPAARRRSATTSPTVATT